MQGASLLELELLWLQMRRGFFSTHRNVEEPKNLSRLPLQMEQSQESST